MPHDVLVIGAGPAGIACAYYLQQAGIDYEVIDRANVIAATWADQYPSLRLNTTRFFSHMPGEKFPLRYGLFPSARQYHDYLVRFVRKHQLNITLGIRVDQVAPEGEGWRVESSRGSEWYRAVVIATGRFSKPYVPHLPGIEHFEGTVLHSHEYKGPDAFAGQRVMVVGNGPSGVDLVVELPQKAALPVYLAMRTGLVLRPRYPYGLPKHLWMILTEYLPQPLSGWLEQKVMNAKYEGIDRYGIKVPAPGDETGAAGTRGPELIHAVRRGQVKPVDSPVDFEAQAAVMPDSSRIEIDAVILATGFEPALDCLAVDYEVDEIGLPLREVRDFVVDRTYKPSTGYEMKGYPGLFIAGVFYQGKGAMFNFNLEGELIAHQVEERLQQVSPAAVGVES
ncbi:MAG: NAD(P)/FAD-dependent oxidoreductase [Anaerolineae bacterium]|nr:NAD(P)/FAD-dependent oxidoreductase [Anaerolineae bacterium]